MTAMRWIVVGLLTVHGLIHLIGVAKAFGWAEVKVLKGPVGTGARRQSPTTYAAVVRWVNPMYAASISSSAAVSTALSRMRGCRTQFARTGHVVRSVT